MQRHYDTDRYGDGDVPEVDYKPYQDNQFEPHPQAEGDNKAGSSGFRSDSRKEMPSVKERSV